MDLILYSLWNDLYTFLSYFYVSFNLVGMLSIYAKNSPRSNNRFYFSLKLLATVVTMTEREFVKESAFPEYIFMTNLIL